MNIRFSMEQLSAEAYSRWETSKRLKRIVRNFSRLEIGGCPMRDVVGRLKRDFKDPEYRHIYDEGFLNSSLATQLKVLREERGWTQAALAEQAGMNQSRVSELEDVNFNSWTIRTLRKLARAFDLRLKISFEEFGTLLDDFRGLNRQGLSKRSFAADPAFFVAAKNVPEPGHLGYLGDGAAGLSCPSSNRRLVQPECATSAAAMAASLRQGPSVGQSI
jgi:transcriptional regulator with XRE-family HTH domain